MASSKDILQTSRPFTHRSSLSSNSLSGSHGARQPHSRGNSRSVLSGGLTRRKSVTNNNAAGMAAAVAAAAMGDSQGDALPIAIGNRRPSKSGALRPDLAALPSPPASMPAQQFASLRENPQASISDSAVEDQENVAPEEGDLQQKARVRRASDGQPPAKEGRRYNRPEIHCQHCGKGYKHSSCLTKHLWEHTPEWSLTSKLLISKHQQVQLLEAASVLLAMNNQPSSPPDSARESSPSVSGISSEHLDGRSSANTTPPPHTDTLQSIEESSYRFSPMLSDDDDGPSMLSRSLHPFARDNSYAMSVPSPPPAASSFSEADQLTKAVAMLSCSYGSNVGSWASNLPVDAPPVPRVPAQYLGSLSLGQSPFFNSFPSQAPESFTRGSRHPEREDVAMEDREDDDMRSRAKSDEDDFGVFGSMEE